MADQNSGNENYFVVHLNQRPRVITGPYRISDICDDLRSGALPWTDLIWTESQEGQWIRLFAFPAVHAMMSEFPAHDRLAKYTDMCKEALDNQKNAVKIRAQKNDATGILAVRKLSPPGSGASDGVQALNREIPNPRLPIYLQVAGSEFGPLSLQEVKQVLEVQKFKDQIYIWYKGLETWFPLEEIAAIKKLDFLPKEFSLSTRRGVSLLGVLKNKEQRSSIRYRIVATCAYSEQGQRISLGVCADISRGGIQVWIEKECALVLNQVLDILILPLSISGCSEWQLKAKVAWIRPDELRLGLMFTEVSREVGAQIANFFKKIENEIGLVPPAIS